MLIQTITTIGFSLPAEYEQMRNFEISNNMEEWHKREDSIYTTYTKVSHYTKTKRGTG